MTSSLPLTGYVIKSMMPLVSGSFTLERAFLVGFKSSLTVPKVGS
jgi:hypothetical protein